MAFFSLLRALLKPKTLRGPHSSQQPAVLEGRTASGPHRDNAATSPPPPRTAARGRPAALAGTRLPGAGIGADTSRYRWRGGAAGESPSTAPRKRRAGRQLAGQRSPRPGHGRHPRSPGQATAAPGFPLTPPKAGPGPGRPAGPGRASPRRQPAPSPASPGSAAGPGRAGPTPRPGAHHHRGDDGEQRVAVGQQPVRRLRAAPQLQLQLQPPAAHRHRFRLGFRRPAAGARRRGPRSRPGPAALRPRQQRRRPLGGAGAALPLPRPAVGREPPAAS